MQCMDWTLEHKKDISKKKKNKQKTGETQNKVDILFNSIVPMLIS